MLPTAAFRQERSLHGVGLSVLKSGLQKYIRRGEVDKALWCAGELLSFRDAPEETGRKRIETNFRHRLMIIFLEDVGDVGMWSWVDEMVFRHPLFGSAEGARIVHELVTKLAKAPKARICSHANAVALMRVDDERRTLAYDLYPKIHALYAEYAKDKRSRKAQEAKWDDALLEALAAHSATAYFWASAIDNDGEISTKGRKKKPVWRVFCALEAFESVKDLVPVARRWYQDFKGLKESFMCWMLPLLAHIGRQTERLEMVGIPYKAPKVPFPHLRDPKASPMKLDPYVYDMHVGRGGKEARVRFALEGALVVNESAIVNTEWKRFYEDHKRVIDGVKPLGPERPKAIERETDMTFIVRTQVVTSRGKTDTYFATVDGRLMFVKGPLASEKEARQAREMHEWKKAAGLPVVETTTVQLIPDRWPEGTPLGVRNRLPRDEPAWFILAESLFEEPLPRTYHGPTKVWPATEIVDWSQMNTWLPLVGWKTYTAREKTDYVLALLARYVMNVGDQADRNFIRARGRLYSVDDEGRSPKENISMYVELRKNKAALVRVWLTEHWKEIHETTSTWKAPDGDKLKEVQKLKTATALFEE